MKLTQLAFSTLCLLTFPLLLAADERPDWIKDGPYTDDEVIELTVPVEMFANQVHVEVEVNGTPRRFLFDTGSPSMMNAAVAADLGLEAVDRRQSRDSHGAVVETEIVQADLTVGGTTFRKVPVFVAEFPNVAQCLFDGVLGSELLPLCAWQIDVPAAVLRCSTDVSSLNHVAGARRLPLHDFGYPHAPFVDVQLARDARSKALFDTGSPEYLTISPPDLQGAKRNGGVTSTMTGAGSIGGSIGGQAPEKEQVMVRLNELALGDVSLGPVNAVLRESPPSLIGASILLHFVVTLDHKSSTAYLHQYRDGPFSRPSFGFGLAFDDPVSVSMVWDNSPAAKAGLQVGQAVTALSGRPTDTSCAGIRSALQVMTESDTLDIEWDGGTAALSRAIPIDSRTETEQQYLPD
ncbi:MAG TPA: aspartyl protease family protein [Woeseiaceae bacterium]